MPSEQHFFFPPFRLDPVNEQLWRGAQLLLLRPKTFAVLRYLVVHAGRLLTRDELCQAVWSDTHGSERAPKHCIRELRDVLGDRVEAPRFIETLGRRGWRFIAPLTTASPVSSFKFQVPYPPQHQTPNLVGREAELAQLHGWLEKALSGERQMVFVTGEPGIGKTAVVDVFLAPLAGNPNLWIGRGQCVAHYGAGEAYLPVLEALGRLGREAGGEHLIALLGRYAPAWLAQLPTLVGEAELDALQRKVQGVTRERMLREMAEAIEVLTVEMPVVLVLEDLQWSDTATLDWLAAVAQRREAARLLVIATYRPVDVIVRGHPLKGIEQELRQHGRCQELPLPGLTEGAAAEYLASRFAASAFPSLLVRWLHERTEGNPLFLVTLVDDWVAHGVLRQTGGQWELRGTVSDLMATVPESIRQMIEQQLAGLSVQEQHVLEAASVAGIECSAAAVAAGMEAEVDTVEEWCEGLVHRQLFLRSTGVAEWPDATVAARYGFLHALHQQVVYERVPAGRRSGLHRRIGAREETAYGAHAGEIAASLAVHFERGRDSRRAVQYLEQAGKNAIQRCAYREAISHLSKGLELLRTLPDTPERAQQELVLQIALGGTLIVTKGYGAPEVEEAYARARELCQQQSGTPQFFRVLWGLWTLHLVRADYQTARELGEQYLNLAQRGHDSVHLLQSHDALGTPLFYLGEFAAALDHMEQGLALYDPQKRRSSRALQDLGVDCLCYAALTLWHLGYPAQAKEQIQAAITLARKLEHPFSLAGALGIAGWVYQYCGDGQALQGCTEEVLSLSAEHGFSLFLALGTLLRGWTMTEQRQQEGISLIRQGLAAWRATGAELSVPYYLALLAGAYGQMGQPNEGLSVLAAALEAAHSTEELFYKAELYRLKGELSLQSRQVENKSKTSRDKSEVTNTQHLTPSLQTEAEECFRQAIEIARKQQAKSLELRAVMSLSQLWQQQGKRAEARRMLAEIYGWFTEGFDTVDLQEAKALLAELAA